MPFAIFGKSKNDGPVTNSDGTPFSTTLHFHGIRQVSGQNVGDGQKSGPWSDGVPFVGQCPVNTSEKFTYKFVATRSHGEGFNNPPGTYWYHSHEGGQRTNGLQGALVIKPIQEDFEYDGEYEVQVQEWYESPTYQVPVSILVNGIGRVAEKKFRCNDLVEVNKYLQGLGRQFQFTPNAENPTTNYTVFPVEPGKTYRFRILGLIGQHFPIRVRIDGHKFTAVAADSLNIKPIENLKYLWVSSGERFDILVKITEINANANKPIRMEFIGYTSLWSS